MFIKILTVYTALPSCLSLSLLNFKFVWKRHELLRTRSHTEWFCSSLSLALLQKKDKMWIWTAKSADHCRKAGSFLVLLEAWRGLLFQWAWELLKKKKGDNSRCGREGLASGTLTCLFSLLSDRRGSSKSWQGQRSPLPFWLVWLQTPLPFSATFPGVLRILLSNILVT